MIIGCKLFCIVCKYRLVMWELLAYLSMLWETEHYGSAQFELCHYNKHTESHSDTLLTCWLRELKVFQG